LFDSSVEFSLLRRNSVTVFSYTRVGSKDEEILQGRDRPKRPSQPNLRIGGFENQIGRIFASWACVYFKSFICKSTVVAENHEIIQDTFFRAKSQVFILTKDFFTNAQKALWNLLQKNGRINNLTRSQSYDRVIHNYITGVVVG
jgi:hypothetical protein